MRKRGKTEKKLLIALLLAVCLVAGGCASSDMTTTTPPGDFSVDIVVPYATTTPVPESEGAQSANESPFSISADGKVTLRDTSWIDGGFSLSGSGNGESYYKQLRLGDSGAEVRELQKRLKELSYYSGEVSGVFDSATEEAVKLFELTYGNMQTGIATANLQGRLYASSAPEYNSNAYKAMQRGDYVTLQYGDTGAAVYAMQERFIELDYPISEATGIFDDQTANAVRLFYLAYNLEESEIAVVALQKELFSENARPYTGDPGSAEEYALSIGNVGTAVNALQEQLISLGYLEGSASGTYDEETSEAVRRVQRAMGLDVTGKVNAALQSAFAAGQVPTAGEATERAASGTLRQGDTGEAVVHLQERLIELGYPNVEVTGTFDDATAHAISLLQGTADLEQTGTASEALQAFIFSSSVDPYRAIEDLRGSSPVDEIVFAHGSSGEAVYALQDRLLALDYLSQEPNGQYDSATEVAVRNFQEAIGVEQTGMITVSLLRYLGSRAAPELGIRFYDGAAPTLITLQLGDSGEEVTNLQRRLWERGMLERESVEGSIGIYNTATQVAVTDAQLAMGYQDADGIAGIEFQAFLFSKYGDYLKPSE